MKMLMLTLLIASSQAFAAQNTPPNTSTRPQGYQLKVDWSVIGMPKTSAKILVKEGETASTKYKADDQEYFMDVVTAENRDTKTGKKDKAIFMKFTVGTINAKGERTVVSTPQVIAIENEKAEITVGEKGKEAAFIAVIVSRQRTS